MALVRTSQSSPIAQYHQRTKPVSKQFSPGEWQSKVWEPYQKALKNKDLPGHAGRQSQRLADLIEFQYGPNITPTGPGDYGRSAPASMPSYFSPRLTELTNVERGSAYPMGTGPGIEGQPVMPTERVYPNAAPQSKISLLQRSLNDLTSLAKGLSGWVNETYSEAPRARQALNDIIKPLNEYGMSSAELELTNQLDTQTLKQYGLATKLQDDLSQLNPKKLWGSVENIRANLQTLNGMDLILGLRNALSIPEQLTTANAESAAIGVNNAMNNIQEAFGSIMNLNTVELEASSTSELNKYASLFFAIAKMDTGKRKPKSVKKQYKTMTKGKKHPFTSMYEKFKDEPSIKDPAGLAAWIKDIGSGSKNWRKGKRKKD